MGQQLKNIDDLFREELGSYSEVPPLRVWDAIEKKLDSVPPKAAPYNRWAMVIGTACLLLLLGVTIAVKRTGNADNGMAAVYGTSSVNASGPIAKAGNNTTTSGNTNAGINESTNPATEETTATSNTPTDDNNTTNPTTNKRTANNKQSAIHITTANKRSEQKTNNNNNRNSAPLSGNSKQGNAHTTNKGTENEPDNIYNAARAQNNPDQPATGNNPTAKKDAQLAPAPTPEKKVVPAAKPPIAKKPEAKKPPKPKFDRLELGIKLGYETGFDNDAAKKAVVSPYLQYNLSRKFSVMLQPAIKEGSVNTRSIGKNKSYNKENADSSGKEVGPPVQVTEGTGGPIIGYTHDFVYSQTHDSITKSYTFGGSYTEYELPVLLKYAVTKTFSVYAGVNMTYSKLIPVNEHTQQVKGISRTADTTTFVPLGQATIIYPTSSLIRYHGTDITNYTGPLYSNKSGYQMQFGYMFGFSYEFSKRYLFDALVQQASVNANTQAGYNVNSMLSAPYIRLTFGYRLLSKFSSH